MLKLIVITAIFIVGYLIGAREPADNAVRLGDLARLILYLVTIGVGMGTTGILGYFFYHRPRSKRLEAQKNEIENEKAALRAERDKLQREFQERVKSLVQKANKQVDELVKEECKRARVLLRREIEEDVENRYRDEAKRLNGVKRPEKVAKAVKKKKTSEPTQKFQASNGKIYAKFSEGDPVNK